MVVDCRLNDQGMIYRKDEHKDRGMSARLRLYSRYNYIVVQESEACKGSYARNEEVNAFSVSTRCPLSSRPRRYVGR